MTVWFPSIRTTDTVPSSISEKEVLGWNKLVWYQLFTVVTSSVLTKSVTKKSVITISVKMIKKIYLIWYGRQFGYNKQNLFGLKLLFLTEFDPFFQVSQVIFQCMVCMSKWGPKVKVIYQREIDRGKPFLANKYFTAFFLPSENSGESFTGFPLEGRFTVFLQ